MQRYPLRGCICCSQTTYCEAQLQLDSCLLARPDALVEAASAAFLGALDDSENPTAQRYQEKQPKQRTSCGSKQHKDTVPEIEHGGSALQDDDDTYEPACAPHRKSLLSAPQL